MKANEAIFCMVVLSIVLAIVIGCANDPNDPGKLNPNIPPEVYFVNIYPPDDTTRVSYSSKINWYGVDEDGFIDHYLYYIDGDFLSVDDAEAIPFDEWQTTESSGDTITFSAPMLENVMRLWVRAVDNDGAVSFLQDNTSQNPSFRDFLAVTTPPETEIHLTPTEVWDDRNNNDKPDLGEYEDKNENGKYDEIRTLFCLNGFRPTWEGLTISWGGGDEDGSVTGYHYSWNGYEWHHTTDTMVVATGLPDGVHTFYVSAVDDAMAVDGTPAKTRFETVTPYLEEGILLIDNTTELPIDPFTDENIDNFYEALIDSAYTTATFMEVSEALGDGGWETLSHYSLVIIYREDIFRGTDSGTFAIKNNRGLIKEYLDVGGKLWVIGYYPQGSFGEASPDYGEESLTVDYFGIDYPAQATKVSYDNKCLGVMSEDGASEYLYDPSWEAFEWPDPYTIVYPAKVIEIYPALMEGAEVIYRYDSIDPEDANQGLPVAIEYMGDYFSTALYGFPLFLFSDYNDPDFKPTTQAVSLFLKVLIDFGE
jgi:hypothetical protein